MHVIRYKIFEKHGNAEIGLEFLNKYSSPLLTITVTHLD